MYIDWNSIFRSKWFKPTIAAVLFVAVCIHIALTTKKEPTAAKIERAYDNNDSFSDEPTVFKVTPDKIEVSGPLHPFFEVVNREYKVTNNNIKVELKRISEGLPEPWMEGLEMGYNDGRFEPGFSIELLDADNDIECNGKTSVISDHDDIERLLSLNVGETSTVRFYVYPISPLKFRIGSSFVIHPKEPEPIVEETTPEPTAQSSQSSESSNDSESSDLSEYSDDSDDSEYSENYESSDDSEYSDYDYDPETASTWEKVKHKSKKVYQKSKKATKKTYKKAKQKLRDWLDEK